MVGSLAEGIHGGCREGLPQARVALVLEHEAAMCSNLAYNIFRLLALQAPSLCSGYTDLNGSS